MLLLRISVLNWRRNNNHMTPHWLLSVSLGRRWGVKCCYSIVYDICLIWCCSTLFCLQFCTLLHEILTLYVGKKNRWLMTWNHVPSTQESQLASTTFKIIVLGRVRMIFHSRHLVILCYLCIYKFNCLLCFWLASKDCSFLVKLLGWCKILYLTWCHC